MSRCAVVWRVLTDNGPRHRSRDFRRALKDTRTSPRRTRAYRPHTLTRPSGDNVLGMHT